MYIKIGKMVVTDVNRPFLCQFPKTVFSSIVKITILNVKNAVVDNAMMETKPIAKIIFLLMFNESIPNLGMNKNIVSM